VVSGEKKDYGIQFKSSNNHTSYFFRGGTGLGTMALASLLNERLLAGVAEPPGSALAPKAPHFSPRSKHHLLVYGWCDQLDLFDYKPACSNITDNNSKISSR
jgi:hypothetical protein